MTQARQNQGFWQKWGKPVAMSLLVSGVAVGGVGIITWADKHNISSPGDHITNTVSSSPESIPPTSPTELATTKIENIPMIIGVSSIIITIIIGTISIITTLMLHFDNKVENVRSDLSGEISNTNKKIDDLSNKIDTGHQEIRNLVNSSIIGFNRRIDNTNTRIDQVYQAAGIIDPS